MTIVDILLSGGTEDIFIYPGEHGPERRVSFDELISLGIAAARHFQENGLKPGDRILLLLHTGISLLQSMLGAWFCGAAFVITPIANGESRSAMTQDHLLKRIDVSRPKLVIASKKTVGAISWSDIYPEILIMSDTSLADLPTGDIFEPIRPAPSDLAYLQFTSGSTDEGYSKAVIVTHDALTSNLAGIAQAARIVPNDCMVSWAPLYHDMGLIGVVCGLVNKLRCVLIPVETFSRNPMLLLKAISAHKGTLSPSATFSYSVMAKLGKSRRISDIDLSSWRYAWVGAEPIFPEIIARFNEIFEPRGLSKLTLRPTYGLAESVVIISCAVVDESLSIIHCDPVELRQNGKVSLVGSNTVGAIALVGNGPPISGMAVKIANEFGVELAPCRVGHIWMKGASVTSGYFGLDGSGLVDGWRDTGDLGFIHEEQIFVTGRLKDIIIRGGVNVAPQDIEWTVEQALGLRPGRVVAFSDIRHDQEREEVIVVTETKGTGPDIDALQKNLRHAIVRNTGITVDRIEFVPPGSIPRTTSGKVQRSRARDLYGAGEFRRPNCRIGEKTID